MSERFNVGKQMQQEMAQSLLEGIKMGRSMENLALTMEPLAADDKTREMLAKVAACGHEASEKLRAIYRDVAPTAFKETKNEG